jgi:RNA polymerase sigma-70 factor (ECF subfamily)
MNEEQLVKSCLKGEKSSQRQFYDLYSRKMMGVCLRYANDVADAEDFLQEGFIKVFQKLKSFEFKGSLEGWVRKIIINSILDTLRKQGNVSFTEHIDLANSIEESSSIYQQLNAKELLKIIQELPIGYRTVFNLYAIEGYQHNEISKMLNITESTSKSQYLKAKEQLQKRVISEQQV